jgi:hypothetical protein
MPPRGAIPKQLAVILDQTTMEKGRRPPRAVQRRSSSTHRTPSSSASLISLKGSNRVTRGPGLAVGDWGLRARTLGLEPPSPQPPISPECNEQQRRCSCLDCRVRLPRQRAQSPYHAGRLCSSPNAAATYRRARRAHRRSRAEILLRRSMSLRSHERRSQAPLRRW